MIVNIHNGDVLIENNGIHLFLEEIEPYLAGGTHKFLFESNEHFPVHMQTFFSVLLKKIEDKAEDVSVEDSPAEKETLMETVNKEEKSDTIDPPKQDVPVKKAGRPAKA